MFKRMMAGLMIVVFLAGSSGIVFAQDVFITRTGKFYYPGSSPFVKTRATVKISREDAEKRGYKPSKSYLKAMEKESRTPAVSLQQ